MFLAVAGSRHVEMGWVASPLMQLVATLPEDTTLLLRKGRSRPPQKFEAMVELLATFRGLLALYLMPEAGRNRTGTFIRDIELVDHADAVLVFLDPSEDPFGDGGTAHILQKAVDANKPLYAYAVHHDGLQWIGGAHAPERLTPLSDLLSDRSNSPLTG